ncbi:uncharacterized protein [Parasteatoda tepidariorum]|uniref:uncharacterized protein n=1 Tax=Parasteatoda tepidariorum TaxID=114398 RepID=UPI0039BD7836
MKESSFVEPGKLSFINNQIPTLKDARRKLYLHFPQLSCQDSNTKICWKHMHSDFAPVFAIASIFGISFSDQSDDNSDGRVAQTNPIKKCYDIAFNLICFASLVLTLAFEHNFSASKAMTLTYFIKYLSGFLIRCNMIAGKSKIPQVIKTLSQLYTEVSSDAYDSLKVKIYFECVVITILDLCLFGVSTGRIIIETHRSNLTDLTIFGYPLQDTCNTSSMHILVLAHALTYFISIFTMTACILACCNVHIILHRLVRTYSKTLVESIKVKSTKEGFAEDFVTFRRIMYGIDAADNALSFVTFFAYVACISCFFYTLSSFLAAENFLGRPFFLAENAFVFLFSVIIFTSLTCSGILVSSAGEKLKHRVVCISEIILKKNLPSETLLSFMILFDNIKCSNTNMSGWGMFVITRGFVLSLGGVLITYGVLLFQFGQ